MTKRKSALLIALLFIVAVTGCRFEWISGDKPVKDFVIISTAPADQETNVSQNVQIVIRSTVPMDPDYIITNASEPWKNSQVILVDQSNAVVAVSYSFNGEYLTLTPQTPLAPQSTYGVAIRPGARDIYGENVKTPYAFKFSTGPTLTVIPNWPPFTLPPIGGVPPATPGTFSVTGMLNHWRNKHKMVRLDDGRVLVCGGEQWHPNNSPNPTLLRSAEIYNPATGTWTLSQSNQGNGMFFQRAYHDIVKLNNGHVIITGGFDGTAVYDSVEEYDPRMDSFSLHQNTMQEARYYHSLALLSNGNPIAIGGVGSNGLVPNASPIHGMEILDLKTGNWVFAKDPIGGVIGGNQALIGVYSHKTLILPDGAVFSCGGYLNGNLDWGTLYWPDQGGNGTQGTGMVCGTRMACPRDHHTVSLLSGGFGQGIVIVIGGSRDDYVYQPQCIDTAEVYDHNMHAPVAFMNGTQGCFTPVGPSMHFKRCNHTATVLANGHILVTGGWKVSPSTGSHHMSQERSAEIFDPFALGTNVSAPYAGIDKSGKFDWTRDPQGNQTTLPNLYTGVAEHTATTLMDGRVLIVGGLDCIPANPPIPISAPLCWIYNP